MNVIAELRQLAKEPHAQKVFNVLSNRKPDVKEMSIEEILKATRHTIQRTQIVQLIKALDRLDLCNFVAGRRGFPSRIMFYSTPVSIGKVALGQEDNLVKIAPAEIGGNKANEASAAPSEAPFVPSTPVSDTEGLPFSVSTTALGTLFILPNTATDADKERLAEYIRKMPLKRSA